MKEISKYVLILFLFLCLLGCGIETGTLPIVSLKKDNSIEGDFFIGTGSIESTVYYWTYIKRSDGGFKLAKFNYLYSVIYESILEPHIEYCYDKWWKRCGPGKKYREWHKFYIPKDTIIKEFRLE